MRALRLFLGAGMILAAFLATSMMSFATPAMSKKEKKPCTTCHVTAKSKDLNDVGKHYKEKKTLDGAPEAKK